MSDRSARAGSASAYTCGTARAGAKVAVISHTESEIKKTADEIKRAGFQAFAITADVASAEQMEFATRQTARCKSKQNYAKDHPLSDRPGTADEVAQLALFLASDASAHITGSPIWIDGAESLPRG